MPQVRVDATRCVHARVATASCRACVEVCPRQAWHLDDEGLELSQPDCDGCGLCVSACPTRAIDAFIGLTLRQRLQRQPVVLAACSRAMPDGGAGVVTCLHAIATADLLQHWRRGERVWLICTADCARCPCGHAETFTSRVDHLNHLLEARGEQGILVKPQQPMRWRRLREALANASAARRGFLKRLLSRPTALLQEHPAGDEPAGERLPPGMHLAGQGALPWTIHLDPLACVVCQACLRVCPEQALHLERTPDAITGQHCLRLEHARCTGCSLCIDVCEHQAIRLEAWAEPQQRCIPLRDRVCRRCGAPFKLPVEQADTSGLCWVCTRNRHARRLYHVMDASATTGR